MSVMFRALGNRNYRMWAGGALVSNIGTWMQRVAQDWLVLTVLTDHSGTAVGITTGLQFLPMLLLGPYAGVLADRYRKLVILKWTQTAMGLCGAVVAGICGGPLPWGGQRHRRACAPGLRLRTCGAEQHFKCRGAQLRLVQHRPAHWTRHCRCAHCLGGHGTRFPAQRSQLRRGSGRVSS